MKINILHPIIHDGKEFARGVYDLPEELAELFLTYTWAAEKFVESEAAKIEAAVATVARKAADRLDEPKKK